MLPMHNHRTPRWVNTRPRYYRFSLPQWSALAAAAAIGAVVYDLLTLPHYPASWSLWVFYGRMLLTGTLTGGLMTLFYSLVDDRREPLIRQAVRYPLRRRRRTTKEVARAASTPLRSA